MPHAVHLFETSLNSNCVKKKRWDCSSLARSQLGNNGVCVFLRGYDQQWRRKMGYTMFKILTGSYYWIVLLDRIIGLYYWIVLFQYFDKVASKTLSSLPRYILPFADQYTDYLAEKQLVTNSTQIIYIYIYILMAQQPQWAKASTLFSLRDHRHITLDRIPLDE